jgi:hypothetical protein
MLYKQKNEVHLYVFSECSCHYRIVSLFIKEELLIISLVQLNFRMWLLHIVYKVPFDPFYTLAVFEFSLIQP